MPVTKACVRTELVRGLKAHRTLPATGMSFTFTAPPEPLMPDATAPVSLGAPLGERGELRPRQKSSRKAPLSVSPTESAIAAILAGRWHPAQAAVVIPEVRCVNGLVLRTLR
jgi:hypothetical protein